MTTTGKLTQNAITVLEKRYLIRNGDKPVENPEEMFTRVAKTLSLVENTYKVLKTDTKKLEKQFFNVMWDLDFMPNSPTLMNAGTGAGTLSACYVQDIGDSMESIMSTAHDQALIEKFGGGIGFSLSGIRPKGRGIATTQGKACGPIAVLKTLSQVGTMITQGGKRAGAHMAIMSVYHPDILEFISCKTVEGDIDNFNISVGADARFMEAVKEDKWINFTWPLDRNSYEEGQLGEDRKGDGKSIKARELFDKIITGAWKNGEPGMIWLDKINEDNTTPQLGRINATNPCGEQPLLSGESCNLGSINLGNFISSESGEFDFARFDDVVAICVRFLDNVVDANSHPTKITSEMNSKTRKIGLGVMGWADLLTKLEIPYDSNEALILADKIGSALKAKADLESSKLGKLKGNFPAFDKSPLNKKNGGEWTHMRNAWRLSIAPTGTISMIAEASSGIEPLFALSYKKHNMSSQLGDTELYYINEEVRKHLPIDMDLNEHVSSGKDLKSCLLDDAKNVFKTSHEIEPLHHVRMQAAWQKHVDSGISKTINLPFSASEQDVWDSYMSAWKLGCKGITVYRNGSREKEVLVSTTDENNKDAVRSISDAVSPPTRFNRPDHLDARVSKIRTGHGNLYITTAFHDGRLMEIFTHLGKSGAAEHAQSEALGRVISTALQYGVPVATISSQLRGISSVPVYHNGKLIKSVPDAIASVLDSIEPSTDMATTEEINREWTDQIVAAGAMTSESCDECNGTEVSIEEGCMKCYSCGYSKCG